MEKEKYFGEEMPLDMPKLLNKFNTYFSNAKIIKKKSICRLSFIKKN